jgi:hypothetical protein
MGLSIYSEDEKVELFSGAYSAFFHFRALVRDALSTSIEKMQESLGGEQVPTANTSIPEDPILYDVDRFESAMAAFFDHSDCDGEWTVDECKLVGELLSLVKGKLPSQRPTYAPPKSQGTEEEDNREMALFAILSALASVQKSEEEKLEILLQGLDYCVKNNQKALFV